MNTMQLWMPENGIYMVTIVNENDSMNVYKVGTPEELKPGEIGGIIRNWINAERPYSFPGFGENLREMSQEDIREMFPNSKTNIPGADAISEEWEGWSGQYWDLIGWECGGDFCWFDLNFKIKDDFIVIDNNAIPDGWSEENNYEGGSSYFFRLA